MGDVFELVVQGVGGLMSAIADLLSSWGLGDADRD
jgi:hypothetical protein